MLLAVATQALLIVLIGMGVLGVLLLRRGGARIIGGVLLLQALLALAAQVALSTLPFGIGEPLIRVPFREIALQMASTLAFAGAMAGFVVVGLRWISGALDRSRYRRIVIAGSLLMLPLVAAASMIGLARVSTPERERERDPQKRAITLSPGFAWSIYLQGTIDNPTAIAFGPDGRLYIADIAGTLWVATDADTDHVAESIQIWAQDFTLLVGLAWHGDELYTASSGKIEALRDSDGDGVADQRRVVVEGLPSMVLMPHSNNGIAFGPDGRLYFGVGSTTDGQVEMNPLAAAILSVKPDGSDLKVYARGLGNSFDVAFNSRGDLFAGDNSPGVEGDTDPPDEFNYIVEGGHYGFPYFYGDPPQAAGTRGALVSFPPHSAPTGVTFYSGTQYPPEYRNSGFVTLWGRGEISRVEVARTENGDYLSRASTFGSGFLYPIDTVTGPDGNLYVADFGTSAIYRIIYTRAGTP